MLQELCRDQWACPGGSRVFALLAAPFRLIAKVVQRPESTGASPVGSLVSGLVVQTTPLVHDERFNPFMYRVSIGSRLVPANSRLQACVAAMLWFGVSGCGSSATPVGENGGVDGKSAASTESAGSPIVNPRDIPPGKDNLLVTLKVYSTPPGCLVFVGTDVVRGDGETLAQTPLEVQVPRGRVVISVEKPGGRRASREVEMPAVEELEFDVEMPLDEGDVLADPPLLNTPYFEAAVGRSLELKSLNSSEKDFDPFVEADGKTIWFVSDRVGLRGVYMATRLSPYHDFEAPQLVGESSGADLPASPSVTENGLMLVYAVPEKARIWQLTRTDNTSPFKKKEIIRTDEQTDRAWRSSQVSTDGLRLYWTEEGGDELLSRAAVRASSRKLFGKTLKFELPDHHPHLSSDGLRQFAFDGVKLQRARRGSIKQSFGPPEVIGELTLTNYKVSPRHRQFWVTDDEQWLFYCDDPRTGGDLFLVRLNDGPAWGRSFVGKSIAAKAVVAKSADEPVQMTKPVEAPVDPLTLPLPYTTHWTALSKRLAAGDGDAALALAQQALGNVALAQDRTLVTWDIEVAEHVAEFRRDVTRAVEALKPGATVRVGGTRYDFDRRDGDELHLKLKEKEVVKKVGDLAPGDLVVLADSGPEKGDAAKALRCGIYLHFQGKLFDKVAESWLKRAAGEGESFVARLAARSLIQGQKEIARQKFSDGIGFLDDAIAVAPASDSAKQAAKEKETLYDKLQWEQVGKRKWKRGELGEFLADDVRSNGSYLKSAQQYGNLEVTCEWKVTGPTAMGGVYLRYDGRGNPFENGAKIHLANDLAQKNVDQYSTGSLFGSDPPLSNASLPEGKWNTLRIRVRGDKTQVAINGKDVLKATLDKDVPERGHVVLDGVAGGISYRKVLVFELPKGE